MPCKCARGHHSGFSAVGSTLSVWSVNAQGQRVCETYNILPIVPLFLVRAVRQMIAAAPVLSGVVVYLVKTTRGRGGFFLAPNLIVLGLDDAVAIAEHIREEHADQIAAISLDHMLRHGWTSEPDFSFLVYSAMGRLLAHELGHALRYRGWWAPFTDEEANADYLAGFLDSRRGKDPLLGSMVFFSIGCNFPGCDHPPSGVRSAAYEMGYEDERRAMNERVLLAALLLRW